MRRSSAYVGLLALAALGACGGSGGVPGAGPPLQFRVPGAATVDPTLVGSWAREAVVIDSLGVTRAVVTTWTFNADGIAQRSVITRNPADGSTIREDAFGTWQVQPGATAVVIDFSTPVTGRVTLLYRRVGDTLILADQTYFRVF